MKSLHCTALFSLPRFRPAFAVAGLFSVFPMLAAASPGPVARPTPWLVCLLLFATSPISAAEHPDEQAVKAVIESLLTQRGEGNLDALPPLFVPKASIAYVLLSEGQWFTATTTIEDWYANRKAQANPSRFREPVSHWQVQVEAGRLAFVRADTTIERDDQIKSNNLDYFTLIKIDGVWKIVNASYVNRPVPAK